MRKRKRRITSLKEEKAIRRSVFFFTERGRERRREGGRVRERGGRREGGKEDGGKEGES